jgi:hypothetical protein
MGEVCLSTKYCILKISLAKLIFVKNQLLCILWLNQLYLHIVFKIENQNCCEEPRLFFSFLEKC